MREEQELPVIQACYDFTVWLFPHIQKFPRDLRYSLGQRLETRALDILEGLLDAKYQKQRQEILENVNRQLEKLRFQMRMAKDFKVLPERTFWAGMKQITELGQQVGGWKKQAKGKPTEGSEP